MIDTRPSPWFILIRSWQWIGLAVLASLAMLWLVPPIAAAAGWPDPNPAWPAAGAACIAIGRLGWTTLEWAARRYVLRDGRVGSSGGVLRRFTADVRCEHVRAVVTHRLIIERVLGVGTIAIATAGTGSSEVVWLHVGKPHARAAALREATTESNQ